MDERDFADHMDAHILGGILAAAWPARDAGKEARLVGEGSVGVSAHEVFGKVLLVPAQVGLERCPYIVAVQVFKDLLRACGLHGRLLGCDGGMLTGYLAC